jgi:hypothetical protein
VPFDYILLVGAAVGVVAFLSIVLALKDSRPPTFGLFLAVFAAGFVVWAWQLADRPLAVSDVTSALTRVIEQWRN